MISEEISGVKPGVIEAEEEAHFFRLVEGLAECVIIASQRSPLFVTALGELAIRGEKPR